MIGQSERLLDGVSADAIVEVDLFHPDLAANEPCDVAEHAEVVEDVERHAEAVHLVEVVPREGLRLPDGLVRARDDAVLLAVAGSFIGLFGSSTVWLQRARTSRSVHFWRSPLNEVTVEPGRPIITSVASGSPRAAELSASSSYCSVLMFERLMVLSVVSSMDCTATVGSIVRPALAKTSMICRRCFIVFFA